MIVGTNQDRITYTNIAGLVRTSQQALFAIYMYGVVKISYAMIGRYAINTEMIQRQHI